MSVEDRKAAARALGRVLRHGAWSNVVASVEADRAGVPAPVVQALLLGTIRDLPAIDAAIARAASRPIGEIDPDVADLLRIAAMEIVTTDTPAPLVVDSTVEAVGQVRRRATGFANAVLRRLADDPPDMSTGSGSGPLGFVDDALRHVLQASDVDAMWEASSRPAAVGVRSRTRPEGASPVAGIEDAWLLTDGHPHAGIAVQDPASVAVGNVVLEGDPDLVLDLAAAPGGKTRHLVEAGCRVVAMDRHRRRVSDARRRVPDASWVVGDAAAPPFAPLRFDAVLLDAPCSGLGTLRRRPELRLRVTPDDVARLASAQRSMLESALRLVKAGGRVVYSVCTFTPAETIDVVAGLGATAPRGLPGRRFGDGWLMAPGLGPTDGMFVAVLDG